ncbi:carbohydrate-binding protein [Aureimonas glaciei]|uniref:Alpha-L-rhamnosidase-like protein n=1 Tax=Aureimonas glaciei TaxID=1776957 RepID=A0A916XZD1_9HYPH|nr:carbohydrate-binding protein [Aureimonas glaciei]GGD22941.1 hypothetical protein GCM10011335_27300 [Aureimonas glaciei]
MTAMPAALDAPDWFRTPSADFQPATFWFWHAIPSEPEMTRQLKDMKATGIGTVMVQARLAMPIEDYLSPAYLAAFRFACAEARRLGLRVTIYDEYNWMSGHGGGRTVDGADHLRERHLFWTRGIVGSEGTLSLALSGIASPFYDFLGDVGKSWVYEGGMPLWGEWTIVAAAAAPSRTAPVGPASTGTSPTGSAGSVDAAGAQYTLDEVADVTPLAKLVSSGEDGCRIAVERLAAGTEVTVFVAARCRSSRMINYLMPEAAERFAAVVYAPLLEAAGGTAEGFFFDHPYAGFYGWDQHHGDLGNSLLWDDRLPDLLDDTTPLALQLLALTRDIGAETAGLRTRFFETYQSQLHEAFFGTLSRWTAARGIGFSGHELLTHVGAWGLQDGLGGFDPRSMPGVDYFAIDAFRTHTSVDAADYAPQLSARFGDSVARAHGRKRCTIEQYSTGRETGLPGLAGQWGLTLEKFRAQAIRHLLFGARQILLHAYNASDGVDGDTRLLSPRFDFPPGFNFQPWWEDCPGVFRELSRISAFLEDGEPLRPVALLYPLAAINAGAPSPDCGRHFGWWAEALARAGIGYDIVDEAGLARLMTGGEQAGPGLTGNPALATADSDPFAEPSLAGYRTLILPSADTLATSASAGHLAAFSRAGGAILASGAAHLHIGRPDEDGSAILAGLAGFRLLPAAGKADIEAAVAALRRPCPDIRFDAGPTWNAVLREGATWKIALFNDADVPRRVTLIVNAPIGVVRRWDPGNGTAAVLDVTAVGGAFVLTLAAQEVLCLTVEDGELAPRSPKASDPFGDGPAAIDLIDGWIFQTRGGVASPRAIDVTRGWEVQGFADFAGTGLYRRTVDLPPLTDGLGWHLVLPDVRETAECFVDGISVGRHVAGEAAFALGGVSGAVRLELHLRNTAANRYYPGTPFWDGLYEPSGLIEPPRLEVRAIWVEGVV